MKVVTNEIKIDRGGLQDNGSVLATASFDVFHEDISFTISGDATCTSLTRDKRELAELVWNNISAGIGKIAQEIETMEPDWGQLDQVALVDCY